MAFTQKITRQDKPRSGIAHGGMGTGGVELRADGIFRNWNIFNNFPFGPGPKMPFKEDSMMFFKVRWKEEGKNPQMKLFQIEEGREVAAITSQPHYYIFPWMTGVDSIEYSASYPFTELLITDEEMPFDVKVRVFSPFIPHNVKDSTLPTVIIDMDILLKGKKTCDVMVMTTLRNAVGYNTEEKYFVTNVEANASMSMVEMTCGGMDTTTSDYGTMSISAVGEKTSFYAGWEHLHPYYEKVLRCNILPNHDDTSGRVQFNHETGEKKSGDRCFSTVAVSQTLRKREVMNASFVLSWNFPNLYAEETDDIKGRIEGNYYTNFFKNAAEVTKYVVTNKVKLTKETEAFHKNFFDSDIPADILDQINSHLNTFVSSAWVTKDKNFGIREGLTPDKFWGPLATTDVGMYGSIMPAALFPELDKNTFRAHRDLQKGNGEIGHGICGNFAARDESESVKSRLDMPSQYVLQTLREYFWTNDRAYLDEMWESVKKALDYVLRDRDINNDSLPDMEGVMCSYDNFPMYGAASYIASQWLAALRYAILAARVLEDTAAESKYTAALEKGTAIAEEKLWNGKYFRLYNDEGGARGDLDDGCLTDQIIGQWAADQIGAGKIYSDSKIKKALGYVLDNNYTEQYGLVNCRWPEDGWLHEVDINCWNDQANTNWTGVELGFASLLIYEGLVDEGLMVARNVDKRYRKFGTYFDHFEFGGHYYRPMSAWGIVTAMLGLTIQGETFGFAPKMEKMKAKYFFTHGNGTAHFIQDLYAPCAEIKVHNGLMNIKTLRFDGKLKDAFANKDLIVTLDGVELESDQFTVATAKADGALLIKFNETQAFSANQSLVVAEKD